MPYQHRYETRSSRTRGQPSEHRNDTRSSTARGQPSEHRNDTRSSIARSQPSQHHLDNQQQQRLDDPQQQHLNEHQHYSSFDYSTSSRSPETRAVSSSYDSGQDLLRSYDNQYGRRNNHDEYYSRDNIDTSRNRNRNQSLRPDANAPFGYQLSCTGQRYPAPDPNQLWLVKELNGAQTERTTREIENLSGYWSTTPHGTQYFHRTVPIEVCIAIRQSFVLANNH